MNYEEDGKFVGFDTDLAIAVCDYLKVDYEFKEIVWKNKVMSLNSKEIDVVWNGMTITEELQDAMSITKSYLQNQQVIVCKKADADKFSESADKKGLAGFEVFVETGSAGESTAKELSITPTGVAAQKDTLLNVKTGAKSVAIIDKLMADVLVGEGSANPDLTYVNVNSAKGCPFALLGFYKARQYLRLGSHGNHCNSRFDLGLSGILSLLAMSLRKHSYAHALRKQAYRFLYRAYVRASAIYGIRAKRRNELIYKRNLEQLLLCHKVRLLVIKCNAQKYGVSV
jgi:hypothetical protein